MVWSHIICRHFLMAFPASNFSPTVSSAVVTFLPHPHTLHCGWGRTDVYFKASRVVVGNKLLHHTSNRWLCVNAKPKPDKDMSLHKLNFNLLEMRGSSTVEIEDLIIYSWLSRPAALSGW